MKKLNKDIEEKALALNQWILDQEVVKEYQRYEKLLTSHKELVDIENRLKVLQKEIVNKKYIGQTCVQEQEEYQHLKDIFDQHPLVMNYLSLKQEVNDLLLWIQEDINKQITKKVD